MHGRTDVSTDGGTDGRTDVGLMQDRCQDSVGRAVTHSSVVNCGAPSAGQQSVTLHKGSCKQKHQIDTRQSVKSVCDFYFYQPLPNILPLSPSQPTWKVTVLAHFN